MLQARSNLSRLIEAIEQGRGQEIIVAHKGRPAAKLFPLDTPTTRPRLTADPRELTRLAGQSLASA